MTMTHIRSILQAPAAQALLIQASAAILVLAIAIGSQYWSGQQLTIGAAALLQGGLAALLARRRRLAPWWIPIQLLFPLGVLGVFAAGLPPFLFLGAFILMLALYWTTFRTQVPYYPSTPAIWDTVLTILPREGPVRFIDIGSGFGGLTLFMADRRPDCECAGIELAPLPWLISAIRARMRTCPAKFMRGDYEELDFAAFDVVFAYLSPAAMPALWEKAQAEMRAGTMLLSYEFSISDVKSHIIMRPVADGPALFGWRM